ncbi:MAG TPA: hypothetical protein VFA19_03820 [Gaiellaceae bacterium]|nr:hypothetical protein [Gaiellaceae bacterium]
MALTAIVSYDGTDSDRDALALGRLLARAGASLELVYVRHAPDDLKDAPATDDGMPLHVVLSGSTPDGLRAFALENGAELVVFGSEYRTAPGHVVPQASARRLIDGGPVAVALAPAGLHERDEVPVATIGAVGEDGDPCVAETAGTLAAALGAEVAPRATAGADLLVVGSKPGTVTGRVTISAAAEYLIELARCPVIVLPRGVALAP